MTKRMMERNRDQAQSLEVYDVFKECFFLLLSPSEALAFCLKFHMWIDACPPQCDQFQEGTPGELAEVESQHYDKECLHFTHKMFEGHPEFFCTLYQLPKPLRRDCRFPSYADDPSFSLNDFMISSVKFINSSQYFNGLG
jgi:hypothetical protein